MNSGVLLWSWVLAFSVPVFAQDPLLNGLEKVFPRSESDYRVTTAPMAESAASRLRTAEAVHSFLVEAAGSSGWEEMVPESVRNDLRALVPGPRMEERVAEMAEEALASAPDANTRGLRKLVMNPSQPLADVQGSMVEKVRLAHRTFLEKLGPTRDARLRAELGISSYEFLTPELMDKILGTSQVQEASEYLELVAIRDGIVEVDPNRIYSVRLARKAFIHIDDAMREALKPWGGGAFSRVEEIIYDPEKSIHGRIESVKRHFDSEHQRLVRASERVRFQATQLGENLDRFGAEQPRRAWTRIMSRKGHPSTTGIGRKAADRMEARARGIKAFGVLGSVGSIFALGAQAVQARSEAETPRIQSPSAGSGK